jgi:hypothetical protein
MELRGFTRETGLKIKEKGRVMRNTVISMNTKEGLNKTKRMAEVYMLGDHQETFMKANGSWEREAVRELGEVVKENTMRVIGLLTKPKVMG